MAVGVNTWSCALLLFVFVLVLTDTYGISYDETIIIECTIKVLIIF